MAKRTIKSKYAARDAMLSRQRQLLSGDADLAEIYYEVDPQSLPSESAIGNSNEADGPPPPYTPGIQETLKATPPPAPGRENASPRPSKKPDAPVTALEIVIGIVAQKLKKKSDEIAVISTIKSLVSGRFPGSVPTLFLQLYGALMLYVR